MWESFSESSIVPALDGDSEATCEISPKIPEPLDSIAAAGQEIRMLVFRNKIKKIFRGGEIYGRVCVGRTYRARSLGKLKF